MLSRKLVHRLAKMGFPELFEKKRTKKNYQLNSLHTRHLRSWSESLDPCSFSCTLNFGPLVAKYFPKNCVLEFFHETYLPNSFYTLHLLFWVSLFTPIHFRVPTLHTITLVAKYLPENGISRIFRKQYLLISYHTWHVPLCGVSLDHYSITLGPHEAGGGAKHPSLTLTGPSRGEPSRHLGSSYQQGVSILSPLIADLRCPWGSCRSCMVAPRDHFQDDKGASGIL